MALWKLVPVADPQDSRWQDHGIYTVLVRARTAALARVVAESVERAREGSEPPDGNSAPSFRSAFADEKLYQARPPASGEAGDAPAEGPDTVLSVETHRLPRRPVP